MRPTLGTDGVIIEPQSGSGMGEAGTAYGPQPRQGRIVSRDVVFLARAIYGFCFRLRSASSRASANRAPISRVPFVSKCAPLAWLRPSVST